MLKDKAVINSVLRHAIAFFNIISSCVNFCLCSIRCTMISSKMNRTNGGNRSSRIFVGILLVALACLVVLYYHEHRSAQDAVTLSATLEQQTRTLEESTEKFVALKDACHDEREQLVKANEDQEAKIDTALQQAQDWQQRYELVMNDKV